MLSDVHGRDGALSATSPRAVLRRVLDHLAGLGYDVRAALELEFCLLCPDGSPLPQGLHAYSPEPANGLDLLLDAAVEEVLRWTTPLHHFRRTASRDTELRGCRIRAGGEGRGLLHLGRPGRGGLRRPPPLRRQP
ncbi:hypothetical protein [Streptomyces sp. NPDC008092]|uniref:hypothetical protein n=1 Tax=Streptomyces sp. NPDC008092 TaxID=3364808 RepID=UPI0036E1DD8F